MTFQSFFDVPKPSLTLRLKGELDGVCDGSPIQPSTMSRMTRAEIKAIPLNYDRRLVRLDELFEVSGEPSESLILEGDCSKLIRLGAKMDRGSMLVRGSAGDELAARMKGGRIEVLGDVGNYLAMSMRNGAVIVHGSAGDFVAGPATGERRGMQGGDCLVLGNIGSRGAERMRRGILFVGGNTGDCGAAQMIAGTVIVLGELGAEWAGGMKRGSIVLGRPARQEFAAELTPAREFELSFLPLVWRHLQALVSNDHVHFPTSRWAMRQLGDRANHGLGEILTLTRPTHS
jgi:formylmethanofuran dehydrogenase subunit C